jgi:type I restriction enzyme S subunit
LGTIDLPMPSIDEQHKIVELLEDHLSRLDAALADVKQAKLKAAQFRRSLLQAAFTGNLGLDETNSMTQLPTGWLYESINSIVVGGMIADGDWVESKDQDSNGQVRLTQLADVGDGEFRSRSDRWMNDEQASRLNVNYLRPGDLLMARMPDPLGRTCMVPENIGRAVTVVDVAIIRITRKDVNPKFVMWLLNSPGIRQQIEMLASGTTRRRITRKNLGTIDLPMPSIDEQHKIVELLEDHLSRLDASVSLADAMQKQSNGLKRSLLQAAFTGQLTKGVVSV